MENFSERYGYRGAEPEITIREAAPENLRYAVAQIAVECDLGPTEIREVVCRVLFIPPDRNNWSEYPNIWGEVQNHLRDCEWFKVHDIAEALYRKLKNHWEIGEKYKKQLNRFFREKGIGWELTEDVIVYRGGDTFTAATSEAKHILEDAGRTNAATEIHEAIRDISRRPTPDITGAIHHSVAALECTARDVLNEPNHTLGRLIAQLNLPKPLDTAVEKLWGFASDKARHVREGDVLDGTEAELVVSVVCAVCVFLCKRGVDDAKC